MNAWSFRGDTCTIPKIMVLINKVDFNRLDRKQSHGRQAFVFDR